MLRLERARFCNGGFLLDADLTVETGRIVALIGPSGAGKSTLADGIAGFVPLVAGRVLWHGRDIGAASPGARPVAMVFQDGNLFGHLDVAANVGLGLRPDLRLSAAERARRDAAIARVGLSDMAARRPAALSGGQQSRAALARVLVQDRGLIVLDEPFAALGPALRGEMLDLVAGIAAETGATVLMVTHAPQDARRIADQIILVTGGRAESPRATADLLDAPPAALRAYLGD
ncbi:MAG: ATP-binding cassette domain-containing protein [Rhodobacteraceae bacterium]|nr:ATP-binding cassette domain-containing protein [Paracoccaceae bacterium]